MPKLTLTGPNVYAADQVLPLGAVTVVDGKISQIGPAIQNTAADHRVLSFPAHYHLIPGFIDLHIHGAHGVDVMDGTPAALTTLSQALATLGVTAFLATTMTAPADTITQVLTTVRKFQETVTTPQGARLLGVHLEGPFIAKSKAGAQPAQAVIAPNIALIKVWQTASSAAIKMVTLAPELAGAAELIAYLKQQNIIVALGHSDATFDQTEQAIAAGSDYVTHLFNAMRGVHHREPGLVTAALLSPTVMTEVIADGVHLHPAILKLVLQLKGIEQLVLVTDAMRAACFADGEYELGGQAVQVQNRVARLADGTLAGSVLTMPQALRNMMRYTQLDLAKALRLTSENPAKKLGIFNQKGSIDLHKDADLVVLDDKLDVVLTVCEGQMVYQRGL